jgi:hypothetical protein
MRRPAEEDGNVLVRAFVEKNSVAGSRSVSGSSEIAASAAAACRRGSLPLAKVKIILTGASPAPQRP